MNVRLVGKAEAALLAAALIIELVVPGSMNQAQLQRQSNERKDECEKKTDRFFFRKRMQGEDG